MAKDKKPRNIALEAAERARREAAKRTGEASSQQDKENKPLFTSKEAKAADKKSVFRPRKTGGTISTGDIPLLDQESQRGIRGIPKKYRSERARKARVILVLTPFVVGGLLGFISILRVSSFVQPDPLPIPLEVRSELRERALREAEFYINGDCDLMLPIRGEPACIFETGRYEDLRVVNSFSLPPTEISSDGETHRVAIEALGSTQIRDGGFRTERLEVIINISNNPTTHHFLPPYIDTRPINWVGAGTLSVERESVSGVSRQKIDQWIVAWLANDAQALLDLSNDQNASSSYYGAGGFGLEPDNGIRSVLWVNTPQNLRVARVHFVGVACGESPFRRYFSKDVLVESFDTINAAVVDWGNPEESLTRFRRAGRSPQDMRETILGESACSPIELPEPEIEEEEAS